MSLLFRKAALALLAASNTVFAQASSAPAAEASSASATAGRSLGYHSAFDGHRGFTDQPVAPWRESNEVVGRIGGWRAYAREGQGGPSPGSESAPSAARPATPPASAAPPAGHSGHKKP